MAYVSSLGVAVGEVIGAPIGGVSRRQSISPPQCGQIAQ